MKFKVVNKAFKEKMKVLSDFSFNDGMGSYVRIETADDDTVFINRENNINACEVLIFAKIETEGRIVLPFSELYNVVAFSDTKELIFETSDDFLHIYTDDEKQNFEYKIKLVHMQVEPINWETEQIFSFNASVFTDLLKKAIFFASTDNSRAYLCGVNVENVEGMLRISATDGKRAFQSMPMLNGSEGEKIPPFKAFTIPIKFAKIIVKNMINLKEDIIIKVGANCISVVGRKTLMHTTLIREKFPNLDKVMDYNPPLQLSCEVAPLLKAVLRASACKDDTNGVFLELDTNAITVRAESETKMVTDTIEGHFKGDRMTISFNFDYLLIMLNAYSADFINIGITDPNKPIIAEDHSATYMVALRSKT